jgi:tetratricopeptide (TPR) repeat protein
LPDDIDPKGLDPYVTRELRSLSKPVAERVAKHLIMAGELVDVDPERALAHARAARRIGGRLAVVREAAGICAYHAGQWAEALSELRAARRMSGSNALLHVLADCERALGRPERALTIAASSEAAALPPPEREEMALVEAGARRDLGQLDAALLVLARHDLENARPDEPSTVRLWYSYADLLVAAGRPGEAKRWFAQVVESDPDEETDAAERLADLG